MHGPREFFRRLLIVVIALPLALLALLHFVVLRNPPELFAGVDGRVARLQENVTSTLETVVATTLLGLRVVSLVLVSLAALSIVGHLVARYLRRSGPSILPGQLGAWTAAQRERRAPVEVEIVLGRDDRAMPYELGKFWDGMAGVLRPARWYVRFFFGADTITPKLVNHPDTRTLRFVVAVRADAVRLLDSRLRATYPDVRIRRIDLWGPTSPGGPIAALVARIRREPVPECPFEVVKVRKTRRWLWSLQTSKDYSHSVIESLVNAMAASGLHCVVEMPLTPAPILLERHGRRSLRRHEKDLNTDTAISPTDPGVASAVEQKHLQGAVEGVGRSLYRFDLRVLVPAGERQLARHLAGILSEARGENDLRAFTMRARRRLYVERCARSIPPLLPALRTGIASTAELATLWHLPSLRVKGVGLLRTSARQLTADPAINREPRNMLLVDELGPVGIAQEDRRYGTAVIGAAGTGKSALLLRHIGNVARDPSRALFVVDPKEDLARAALSVIPRDRLVHHLDLEHPYVGFNPLTLLRSRGVSPDVVADVVVAAIRETSADGAVGARSDQFLRLALTAVCTVEDEPTLHHVYRMLDPSDSGYRAWVVRELAHHPEATFIADFWGREFAARAVGNARFLSEIMEAPRNKLSRFLGVPSLSYLISHPVQIDLAGILDRREILVLNGSKASVGEDNAVLVCQLLVLLVQKLLHQQQKLEKTARTPLAFVIDEGHNVFSPSFATMMSEGRSGGVELTVAYQYGEQIEDLRIRAGVRSLLQNVSVFRLREREDARSVAELAMEVYADNIRGDEEDAKRLRIDPTDIVNLPNYRCINLWLSDGEPRHAFTANTIAIEDAIDHVEAHDIAQTHRRRQRQRGDHPHDRGRYITPPLIWDIDTPAIAVDRDVHVDLTAWPDRPDVHADLRIVLSAKGRRHGFRATPSDSTGRRFVTHHGDSPPAKDDADYLPAGPYDVHVLDTATEQEWRPTIVVGRGDDAQEMPATITLVDPQIRDAELAA